MKKEQISDAKKSLIQMFSRVIVNNEEEYIQHVKDKNNIMQFIEKYERLERKLKLFFTMRQANYTVVDLFKIRKEIYELIGLEE